MTLQPTQAPNNQAPNNQAPNKQSVYLSSIGAMTLAFFVGVGLPCWLAFGAGWGAGLGAMCAVWGGPGFGVMAGSARLSLAEERAEEQVELLGQRDRVAERPVVDLAFA